MELDASPITSYVNRPGHAQTTAGARGERLPGRNSTRRAVDRMFLALRTYEQRAQRRAAMRAWLVAAGTAKRRSQIAAPDATSG